MLNKNTQNILIQTGNTDFKDRPLLLAPMEDITDTSFRTLCKRYGADLMFTEFVASEALVRNVEESFKKMKIVEHERPLGIQLFGHDVNSMKRAAMIAEQAHPDMIDINFGCPVKKITTKGAGAAMLKDIDKMQNMVSEVVKAVHLPVTVKTRLGWDEQNKNIIDVILRLQDAGIKAITIHGRTRARFYKGLSDWSLIGQAKEHPKIHIPVYGNGDIDSPQVALDAYTKYNVDGIMIGRGAIGNPWIFNQIKHYLATGELLKLPGINEKVNVAKEHLILSVESKGCPKGVHELRPHLSTYFKGLPGFKKFRNQLLTLKDQDQVMCLLDEIKETYS